MASRTAAWREESCFPGTDRGVSGPGDPCWSQHTHYRGSYGGKPRMRNPCVLLSSTKKSCACPGTPPLLLDVTTARISWLKCSNKPEISVAATAMSPQPSAIPSAPAHLCSKTPNSSLTNLIALYGEMTGLVRAVGVSYENDSNAFFQDISHEVLIDKLVKYGLDNQTVRWVSLGLDWLKNVFIHQTGGAQVETKLTTSQQHVLTAKKVTSLLGCVRQTTASRSREGIPPLCSALVGHIQVLGPGPGSPVQERHGHSEVSPAKGHKDD